MKIEGSYTRKRDSVTCTYTAKTGRAPGGTVTWDARVYVDDRFVGTPGGQLLASMVSLADLEQLIRSMVERSIEDNISIQI
jgi:hypothetical protein